MMTSCEWGRPLGQVCRTVLAMKLCVTPWPKVMVLRERSIHLTAKTRVTNVSFGRFGTLCDRIPPFFNSLKMEEKSIILSTILLISAFIWLFKTPTTKMSTGVLLQRAVLKSNKNWLFHPKCVQSVVRAKRRKIWYIIFAIDLLLY